MEVSKIGESFRKPKAGEGRWWTLKEIQHFGNGVHIDPIAIFIIPENQVVVTDAFHIRYQVPGIHNQKTISIHALPSAAKVQLYKEKTSYVAQFFAKVGIIFKFRAKMVSKSNESQFN